jgi:hypothetical protein
LDSLAMGILWSLKAVKPHVNWIHIQIVYHLSIAYSYYSKIISSQVELIISLIMDTSKCYCISWLAGWTMMWYICWLFVFWLFLFCVCLCFVLLSACMPQGVNRYRMDTSRGLGADGYHRSRSTKVVILVYVGWVYDYSLF